MTYPVNLMNVAMITGTAQETLLQQMFPHLKNRSKTNQFRLILYTLWLNNVIMTHTKMTSNETHITQTNLFHIWWLVLRLRDLLLYPQIHPHPTQSLNYQKLSLLLLRLAHQTLQMLETSTQLCVNKKITWHLMFCSLKWRSFQDTSSKVSQINKS